MTASIHRLPRTEYPYQPKQRVEEYRACEREFRRFGFDPYNSVQAIDIWDRIVQYHPE